MSKFGQVKEVKEESEDKANIERELKTSLYKKEEVTIF